VNFEKLLRVASLVWRKLENYEKAIESYTKELFFSKDNQKTYNRAYCYAKLGKFKEAVSDYTKALSLDPNNIHALHNRGICYERLGLFRNVTRCLFFSISRPLRTSLMSFP